MTHPSGPAGPGPGGDSGTSPKTDLVVGFAFPATGAIVRTVSLNGEPWFVARDVCSVLAISNDRDAFGRLPERMKGVGEADTPGGRQKMNLVSEAGVYRLVMRSNLPSAQRFQDWLAEEVIPAIRRTGQYSVAPTTPALPDITTPTGVLALAEMFAQTARQLVEADDRIREMEPKALAHDAFLTAASGDVLVRQAAKLLGWQEKLLRQFLVDEHLIYERQATCGARQWDFYAANRDHFAAVAQPVEHGWGRCVHYTLYITPRGMDLIHKRIGRRQDAMRQAIGGVR